MSAKTKKLTAKSKKAASGIHCCECNKLIPAKDQALFVEEEVGRYFCQESCIVAQFSGDIEKLEREYGRHVAPTDLSSEDRESYSHLRWKTLEEPSEVWREKVSSGDYRYTYIAQFTPDKKPVWGVAVCLMLRGDPSFLFIAFATNDSHLVDVFRKGERQKISRKNGVKSASSLKAETLAKEEVEADANAEDGLAEPWSESDSVRASIVGNRKSGDISPDDFGFYQKCLEETLQEPTELWSYTGKKSKRVYHFIREYEHDANYWYVVMAKDTTDETQIEIIDAFPTKDQELIKICRHGKKEVLGNSEQAAEANAEPLKRTVH